MFKNNPIKSLVVLAGLAAISLNSCTKKTTTDETCVPVTTPVSQSDSIKLKDYIINSNIVATFDSRGFYYSISDTGSTNKPTNCSTVNIDYQGKLTNGVQFDSNLGTIIDLNSLVSGFRMAMDLIGEGGTITMYLPPSLAYGNDDYSTIPGGSILIFKVKLNSITKK